MRFNQSPHMYESALSFVGVSLLGKSSPEDMVARLVILFLALESEVLSTPVESTLSGGCRLQIPKTRCKPAILSKARRNLVFVK